MEALNTFNDWCEEVAPRRLRYNILLFLCGWLVIFCAIAVMALGTPGVDTAAGPRLAHTTGGSAVGMLGATIAAFGCFLLYLCLHGSMASDHFDRLDRRGPGVAITRLVFMVIGAAAFFIGIPVSVLAFIFNLYDFIAGVLAG